MTNIYVILLPQMDENKKLGYMIKIGYSDSIKGNRLKNYNQYHRTVKVLHSYNGDFTIDDETKLKQHFKEYVLFGREWFRYCPEVLDFFDTYDTPEKLKAKLDTMELRGTCNKKFNVDLRLVEFIINKNKEIKDLLERQNKRVEIYNELRNYKPKDQIIHICSKFNVIEKDIEQFIKDYNSNIEITEKAHKLALEFNDLSDSHKKLKMLVDLKNLEGITDNDINSFLELVHPKYKEYYLVMGPDFIRQFSCKEAEIKREWTKLKSNSNVEDDVSNEIYKLFSVGQRYTKKDIKESLEELYQKLGYQKTAKATDLEPYFELKPVFTKDKKHGFEIIGKR